MQRIEIKINNQGLIKDPEIIIKDLTRQNRENRIQASFLLMKKTTEGAIDALINALHREPSGVVKHEIIFSLGERI